MFPNKKNKLIPKGDFVTESEAFLETETEIAERCETVSEVVQEQVMSLPEALEAYGLTTEQYLGYIIMRGKKEKVQLNRLMLVSFVKSLLDIMDISKANDNKTQQMIDDMRQYIQVR